MNKLEKTPLLLGSASPRRAEILKFFSLPFEQVVSHFDEEQIEFKQDPEEYVLTIASQKAEAIRKDHPNSLILTADTVVFKDDKVYGKPKNYHEAVEYLTLLSNSWHTVYTGLVLVDKDNAFYGIGETHILFNKLTEDEIKKYLDHIDWKDKAGSYAIQGMGSILTKEISGCYYNVMGLPVNVLKSLLNNVGINLWNYL